MKCNKIGQTCPFCFSWRHGKRKTTCVNRMRCNCSLTLFSNTKPRQDIILTPSVCMFSHHLHKISPYLFSQWRNKFLKELFKNGKSLLYSGRARAVSGCPGFSPREHQCSRRYQRSLSFRSGSSHVFYHSGNLCHWSQHLTQEMCQETDEEYVGLLLCMDIYVYVGFVCFINFVPWNIITQIF